MPMRNPCRMPVKSAATHSGLGWPARALSHASAFRGVAMVLAVSPERTPVHGTVWNGGACSLQNCLASTGAMTVDVDIGMLPTASTIGARGRQLMLCCGSQLYYIELGKTCLWTAYIMHNTNVNHKKFY